LDWHVPDQQQGCACLMMLATSVVRLAVVQVMIVLSHGIAVNEAGAY
jgi:hypothetical protein